MSLPPRLQVVGRIEIGVRALASCVAVALVLAFGGCFQTHVDVGDDESDVSAEADGGLEAVEEADGTVHDVADDTDDDDGGEAGPTRPSEGVWVQEIQEGSGTEEAAAGVVGAYLGAPWPTGSSELVRDGACALKALEPDPPEGPPSLDAGMLRLSGLVAGDLAVPHPSVGGHDPNRYSWACITCADFLVGGAVVRASFDGGSDLGFGSGSVVAPDPVAVLSPDLTWQPSLDAARGLTFQWIAEAGTIIDLQLWLSPLDWLECIVPDEGSLEIPEPLLRAVDGVTVDFVTLIRSRCEPFDVGGRSVALCAEEVLEYEWHDPTAKRR
jgi:hypothetical protein